jgi:hypothetical protein
MEQRLEEEMTMAVDGVMVPIVLFIVGGATVIFTPLVRAYARRMEKEGSAPRLPADVTARLERMENAIDSIAIEVERISEGQRFTTKLLSERTGNSPPPSPSSPIERSP